jgi:HD-GYP domain-containing protein (c-di-GMP phosphodiesterase class II)
MDFSAQLDKLQQQAVEAKVSAQAAVSESREQLRQRIDQAKVDADLAAKDTRQQVSEVAASARSTWAQMKADAAAKLDEFEARMDRRVDQRDAKVAARQADGAEADAADAIEFAAWTVDHARLAVLDAIDARVYADELTKQAAK